MRDTGQDGRNRAGRLTGPHDRRRGCTDFEATCRPTSGPVQDPRKGVRSALLGLAISLALGLGACAETESPPAPEGRRGEEFFAAGQVFDAGTPILTWLDEGGYDAYQTVPRFEDADIDEEGEPVRRARYGTREIEAELADAIDLSDGWSIDELQAVVRQFVIHYDVAGASRQCFKILHDKRNLSVHFLLDVDGTIYQTLDLRERAWHAGSANGASIGVEIAHIGAYPAPGYRELRSWYEVDDDGPRVTYPAWMPETGVRTPDFVARPARRLLMTGRINGRRLYQYDFTAEQYEALAHLVAAVHTALPRVRLAVPRDADGNVREDVLSDDERREWCGLLGHWHVRRGKSDPGPAFDWDRVLARARTLVDGASTRRRSD